MENEQEHDLTCTKPQQMQDILQAEVSMKEQCRGAGGAREEKAGHKNGAMEETRMHIRSHTEARHAQPKDTHLLGSDSLHNTPAITLPRPGKKIFNTKHRMPAVSVTAGTVPSLMSATICAHNDIL